MNDTHDHSRLAYRRQFLLSSTKCPELDGWDKTEFHPYTLYIHKDCSWIRADRRSDETDSFESVVLIGHVLDPHNQDSSTGDIARELVRLGSVTGVADRLYSLSGRFVLVIRQDSKFLIFHDAGGLKSVFFTWQNGHFHAASQPLLLGLAVTLKKSELHNAYFQSDHALKAKDHVPPIGHPLFEDVGQLIPNHYLDSEAGRQVRYYPEKPLRKKTFRQGAEGAADLLRKTMLAASRQHNLLLFLSAGLDSRMVLSACREFKEQLRTCTLQFHSLDTDSADIVIAKKVTEKLGVRHDVIDCKREIDLRFEKLLHRNTDIPHAGFWGRNAYGLHQAVAGLELEDHVCVKGEASPVAKCFYYGNGDHPRISSHEQLVSLINGWDCVAGVPEQVRIWFEESRDSVEQTGHRVLDLFYWEQRLGGWTARNQLEMDIVMDTFVPLNNRELMDLLLGVDSKHRCKPDYELFCEIIRILWPDVLREPVNPHKKRRNVIKKTIRKFVRRISGSNG